MNIPSSVGGHAASHEDDDDVEDAITPEFRKLLSTVTRDVVDKQPTRCPHPETAERMVKVCIPELRLFAALKYSFYCSSASSERRKLRTPLEELSPA